MKETQNLIIKMLNIHLRQIVLIIFFQVQKKKVLAMCNQKYVIEARFQ